MGNAAIAEPEVWVPDFGVGDRLRVVRRKRHRSQQEMADLLGVKKVTYASWEAGIASPPHAEVIKLAKRLYMLDRVPQWWTLGADDPGMSSHSVYDYGSEGWGFESLRARPDHSPWPPAHSPRRRRSDHRQGHVVPLRLVSAIPA